MVEVWYGLVSTWMGDCLRTGKPSRYIHNQPPRSTQPSIPPGVSKSSTSLLGRVYGGCVHPCRVAGNTDRMWQVTLRSSEMGSREELYTPSLSLFFTKCRTNVKAMILCAWHMDPCLSACRQHASLVKEETRGMAGWVRQARLNTDCQPGVS